jgi:hypothetical protein
VSDAATPALASDDMQNDDGVLGMPGTDAPPVLDVAPACGSGAVVMGSRCSAQARRLITEQADVYALSATASHLYAATWGGLSRVELSGGTVEELRDEYTTLVVADDRRFFWADSSSELYVQVDDGESELFLPTHSSIEAVSQDDDAIFAITDGYLMRVTKESRAVELLIDGTSGTNGLHWSETAVDDEHVYFISFADELALERIRKDGTERVLLASGIVNAMDRQWLLVDDSHVYLSGAYNGLLRVPVTGGEPERLPRIHEHDWPDPVMTQDDACIYYADGASIYCLVKADCTTELVHTVPEGGVTALTMRGSELYFGVIADGPAVAPKGWVGSLSCAQDD